MFLSKLFLPITKNLPADAKIKSHQLMLRAGMIKQSSAGIYSWLPLGLKIMKKIEQVVREEQNKIGAQELLMPTIQSADIWKESGTACVHMQQTHAFIRILRIILEEASPHVLILTETNVPHHENLSYFGSGMDEAHLIYNFSLPPLIAFGSPKKVPSFSSFHS